MKDNDFVFSTMKEICDTLNDYRDKYYNSDQPAVSDSNYDALFDKLVELERATGVVYANSPTRTVGYPILEGKKKVKHPYPLLSMQKTKDLKKFGEYFKGKHFLLSFKLDGLTTELLYNEGKLVQASTRGNGKVGEDITDFIPYYTNIPLTIPFKGKLRVVGESIIRLDDFEKINEPLPVSEKYSNARNLVSGSLGLLDTKEFAKRKVRWFCFNVLEYEGVKEKSLFDLLAKIRSLGFEICPHSLITDLNHLKEEVGFLTEAAIYCRMGIDGLVGRFDNLEYGKELGVTSHHPLDSIAYKFYDETYETTLREIEWQTSKDGRLFPKAVFDTVTIDGADIGFATLHNIRYIQELKLGVGDKILVSKRNQVIPAVEKNLTRSNTYRLPTVCPSCGNKLSKINIGNTDYLICDNTGECRAQKAQFFKRLVSRDGLNIEGLSEATIGVLLTKEILDTPKDLWDYVTIKDTLSKVGGFGEKSINNLIQSLEKAKDTTISNFVYALSIPLIGRIASRTIDEYFEGDIDRFMMVCDTFDYSKLRDFGKAMSESIVKFFNNNKGWVEELRKVLKFSQNGEKVYNSFLKDRVFCVTGAFETMSRKEIEKIIVEGGGKLTGSVSKNTDYLLTNDKMSGSSKNVKARELGTPILNEKEFLTRISE